MLRSPAEWNLISAFAWRVMKIKMEAKWARPTEAAYRAGAFAVEEILSGESSLCDSATVERFRIMKDGKE